LTDAIVVSSAEYCGSRVSHCISQIVAELPVVLEQRGDKFIVNELSGRGKYMEIRPYYWQPNPAELTDVQINRKVADITVLLKEALDQVTVEDWRKNVVKQNCTKSM
jgi:hypothetical protein